jgi:hypothetical protein
MLWGTLYRAIEQMSAQKVAATGGAGASVTLASTMVDPGAVTPWLHMLTLGIGAMTGIASFVLVGLKIVQQWRDMNGGAKP